MLVYSPVVLLEAEPEGGCLWHAGSSSLVAMAIQDLGLLMCIVQNQHVRITEAY
jgi:hypothetical protein